MSRPEGVTIFSCKIVLKVKRSSGSTIDKYEAHFVALECFQKGSQVTETFPPVVNFTFVRVTMYIAALNIYAVHQMDVSNAFLHGKLDQPLYMMQPEKLQENGQARLFFKPQKSTYGLKQVLRIWYHHFKSCTENLSFTALLHSECIFVRTKKGKQMYLVVHVDNLLIMSRCV